MVEIRTGCLKIDVLGCKHTSHNHRIVHLDFDGSSQITYLRTRYMRFTDRIGLHVRFLLISLTNRYTETYFK